MDLIEASMGQVRRPKEADWERVTLKEFFSCTLGVYKNIGTGVPTAEILI